MLALVAAIKTAVQDTENPAVADALAMAVVNQQGRERVAARKRKQDEEEAARRLEEAAVMSALGFELRKLRDTDPAMTLLDSVEFVTADLGRRIALYSRCLPEDTTIGSARDLALLDRRAMAEGFQV